MRSLTRSFLIALVAGLAWGATTGRGQSLVILRQADGELVIEASAPAETPYVLQVSRDLRDWTALKDDVRGALALRLDSARTSQEFFRLVERISLPDINLVLLGDSTVADLVNNGNTVAGWGQGMYRYFRSEARVVNLAYPCYSTAVFLASAEKAKLLAIKPAFVLIQFGLVDWVGCQGFNQTSLSEYGDNLRAIVELVRSFDGIPILITPPAFRQFDGNGRITPVMLDHCAITRSIATELNTGLIDLNQLTTDRFNALGPADSAYLSWGSDVAHFSYSGAIEVAGLVVTATPADLRRYVVIGGR